MPGIENMAKNVKGREVLSLMGELISSMSPVDIV